MQNGCSNVKGVPCVREVIERKTKPAAPKPQPEKASGSKLASAFGQAKPPKPKAASAPAAATSEKIGVNVIVLRALGHVQICFVQVVLRLRYVRCIQESAGCMQHHASTAQLSCCIAQLV